MPNQLTIWDDSESDHEDNNDKGGARGGCIISSNCGMGTSIGGGNSIGAIGGVSSTGPSGSSGINSSELHLDRGCSDLYEDDEDSEAAPRYQSSSGKQKINYFLCKVLGEKVPSKSNGNNSKALNWHLSNRKHMKNIFMELNTGIILRMTKI